MTTTPSSGGPPRANGYTWDGTAWVPDAEYAARNAPPPTGLPFATVPAPEPAAPMYLPPMQYAGPPARVGPKPWYKRPVPLAILATVALLGLAIGASGGDSSTPAPAAAPAAQAPAAPAPAAPEPAAPAPAPDPEPAKPQVNSDNVDATVSLAARFAAAFSDLSADASIPDPDAVADDCRTIASLAREGAAIGPTGLTVADREWQTAMREFENAGDLCATAAANLDPDGLERSLEAFERGNAAIQRATASLRDVTGT